MPSDHHHIAAGCWKRGSEALGRENWDYAIQMFTQAATLEPDNLVYRQSLRGAECRKYKNNKTGARMASAKLLGIRGRIKKAKLKEDWKTADIEAEKGLAINPWDVQLNVDMAEACAARYFREVAAWGYRRALESDPLNMPINRSLGKLLEECGEYVEAVKCWERVRKVDPLNTEAREQIMGLQAKSVIDRGGYDDAETTQDVKTAYDYDRPVRTAVPEAVAGPGVSVEADLQHAVRKDPSKETYLKLADYYRREKRLEETAEALRKAFEVSQDINVREQLEDVEIMQLQHNLALAREALKANPDDTSTKRNVSELATELVKRQIAILAERVERYPQDHRLKYELARRYMRVKKWRLAIPLLQRAIGDVRLTNEVGLALAKCFLRDGQAEPARRQLEKTLPNINVNDHPEMVCEVHYLLGRIHEKAGRRDDAEQRYSQVIGVDYNYQDARARLERLQSAGSAAATQNPTGRSEER